MIPRLTRLLVKSVVEDHVTLCSMIRIPNHQIRREIEIISTGICIGAGIKPGLREKRFIKLLADRHAPISSGVIVPGGLVK